ncbi:hypothetical protein PIB30_078272 [Stylosanthes scabra]|uniref:Uncharacterized protein n=1 Tax=Stylosanthes scabra TaxID=79078 RepID=A0ABU6US13_9FABA|nr:hypothetical protein [Stylosanthes scabra]
MGGIEGGFMERGDPATGGGVQVRDRSLEEASAEFDHWKSHVTQMYTFMQQIQATSSSSMPPPPPPLSFSARPPRPPPAATASAPTHSYTHPDYGSSSDDEDYD